MPRIRLHSKSACSMSWRLSNQQLGRSYSAGAGLCCSALALLLPCHCGTPAVAWPLLLAPIELSPPQVVHVQPFGKYSAAEVLAAAATAERGSSHPLAAALIGAAAASGITSTVAATESTVLQGQVGPQQAIVALLICI